MEMFGEQRIAATREKVWAGLNNPAMLQRCIPGCESVDSVSPTRMRATAKIKVGPITARFAGDVALSDLDPPNGYRIDGEGQGGLAGFARGGAVVRLEADGEATLLRYEVTAQVGGKLAQLGARLIDATARQMASAFFARFAQELDGGGDIPLPLEATAPAPAPAPIADGSVPMAGKAVSWASPLAGSAIALVLGWYLVRHPNMLEANGVSLIAILLAVILGWLIGRDGRLR